MFSLLVFVFSTRQVVKRSHDIGEPLDEMPIVTNESNKRLNLSISIWRWTLGDGLQILLGGEYPLLLM